MSLVFKKAIKWVVFLPIFFTFACTEKPGSKLIEQCLQAGAAINGMSEKLGSSSVSDYKKILEKSDKTLGVNELYHQYEGDVVIEAKEDAIISTYEVNSGLGTATMVTIETVSSLKKTNEEIISQLRKKIGQKPRGFCFSDCSEYTNERFEKESKKINEELSKKMQSATLKGEKKTFTVQAVLGANLDEKPTQWKCTGAKVKQ